MRNIITIALLIAATTANARQWTGIVLHHTDSDHGTVADIHRWHNERGWNGCGYHLVIYRNGVVACGRSLSRVGAHAKGRNSTHIGLCLVGRDTFTKEQKKALSGVLRLLRAKYGQNMRVERHHEKCVGPGVDVDALNDQAQPPKVG